MRRIFFPWLATLVVVGCGEAERPRFVPADGSTPKATGTREAGGAPGEASSPRNIEMH